MALAIDCPHCGSSRAETVRRAWFIQGFLLFARWVSKPYIGCASCTRSKLLTSMAVSGLFGWWCFPWGLGVPIVRFQNTIEALAPPSEHGLRRLLAEQGVNLDDLVVDETGRSAGDRRLVEGVLATLHRTTWADGPADPREVVVGAAVFGVDGDAHPVAVRSASQRLAVEAGELEDAEQAAARREELEFAYQTLLRA